MPYLHHRDPLKSKKCQNGPLSDADSPPPLPPLLRRRIQSAQSPRRFRFVLVPYGLSSNLVCSSGLVMEVGAKWSPFYLPFLASPILSFVSLQLGSLPSGPAARSSLPLSPTHPRSSKRFARTISLRGLLTESVCVHVIHATYVIIAALQLQGPTRQSKVKQPPAPVQSPVPAIPSQPATFCPLSPEGHCPFAVFFCLL